MIILIVLLVAFFALAFFLSGEGDSYGSRDISAKERRKFPTSDRNFFL